MPTSFKDIIKQNDEASEPAGEPSETTVASGAASKILAAHSIKDKRIAIRINSTTYEQFATINKKRGAASGTVINMLITEYILQYKDLLD